MRATAILVAIIALVSIAHATPPPTAAPPPNAAPPPKAVPVREPCALVVVVDRSRSMRGAKLAAVKHAVVDILGTLDPSDQLAVVGFGRDARVVVPLQAVGRRKQIAAQVARLRAGDGGDVVAGLAAAAAVLEGTALRRRRVVVITDSDALLGVRRAAGALLGDGITVSAVGLQSLNHAGLDEIADAGGGRSLRVEDLTVLPSILVAETTMASSLDPHAVVLVLDRSGSIGDAKLERTKEIARVVVEVLAPADLIAVVGFDEAAQVVVPLQRAANRMAMSAAIARMTSSGGGTNVFVGLAAASDALAGVKGAVKHVIVVSDGDAPSDGVVALVTEMRARGITTSAVGLAGADRNVLSMIADAGDGRLYLVEDLGGLPRLFMRETRPDGARQ